jgi:hypothetical protein
MELRFPPSGDSWLPTQSGHLAGGSTRREGRVLASQLALCSDSCHPLVDLKNVAGVAARVTSNGAWSPMNPKA